MVKSFLWTRLLVAPSEGMLPTAYVDARTTKIYFRELFLAVPILQVKKLLRRF
jgi:hypothetical protein